MANETEFSHGDGYRPARALGYEPSNLDALQAYYRTDPADPGSTIEGVYDEWEKAGGASHPGRPMDRASELPVYKGWTMGDPQEDRSGA